MAKRVNTCIAALSRLFLDAVHESASWTPLGHVVDMGDVGVRAEMRRTLAVALGSAYRRTVFPMSIQPFPLFRALDYFRERRADDLQQLVQPAFDKLLHTPMCCMSLPCFKFTSLLGPPQQWVAGNVAALVQSAECWK
eukprot:8928409-Alexandrium_andersonii.AAC.1